MEYIIRPVNKRDAEDLNRIRRQPGVLKHTLGMPSDRLEGTESFLSNVSKDNFIFVAEVDNKVVGVAGLHLAAPIRERHIGSVGISVDVDYHGNGIGRALMNTLLDMADNYLKLVRVELAVNTNNEKAKKLYESLGFEVEGIRKYAVITGGEYNDDYYMARYNL